MPASKKEQLLVLLTLLEQERAQLQSQEANQIAARKHYYKVLEASNSAKLLVDRADLVVIGQRGKISKLAREIRQLRETKKRRR